MTLSEPDALVSTPMISQSPTRLPITIRRFGQLMRLLSTSFGTSTPACVATDARNDLRKPFCVRLMCSVTGSMVERCSEVRITCTASASKTRQAPAAARSIPTTTAAAATAAAMSLSVRVAGADEEARRKLRSSGPSGVSTTVLGLRAPCAMPA